MLAPEVEARPWAEQLALDDESYRAQLAYLFERSDFYREKLTSAGIESAEAARRPRRDCPAPADGKDRAQGDRHGREPVRLALLCRPHRDRPHLLDERHDRDAELPAAHGERPRELDHRLGPQLRGLRCHRRTAHRLHVQRRPVRRRRCADRLRAHRPLPRPGRNREHRAPAAGDRAPQARGRRPDALLRRLPRRVGAGAGDGPAGVERRARPRRGRAGRGRAGLPRQARGGLGRAGHRGDGHRRHRPIALG